MLSIFPNTCIKYNFTSFHLLLLLYEMRLNNKVIFSKYFLNNITPIEPATRSFLQIPGNKKSYQNVSFPFRYDFSFFFNFLSHYQMLPAFTISNNFFYASVNAATTFGNSMKWDALTKTASPSFTVARSSSVISSRIA